MEDFNGGFDGRFQRRIRWKISTVDLMEDFNSVFDGRFNSGFDGRFQQCIRWKIQRRIQWKISTADLMEDSTADLDVDDNEIVNSVLLFLSSYISSSSH
ncbi:hypothetical protein BDDG_13671 [Blastomyces dermatitidis ATCC 18188]|uniref:Uncharacterized protein n=1 Tax=Ajellomyces dermatitidis (strain ATCC 18188 / CBS 674.68) TaxID=653446 RepID=A0A0J9EU25_AJEDA|nr:hypothetical protein BDDG_13671 [Blastomyces dermatitidis ATCC 18188]